MITSALISLLGLVVYGVSLGLPSGNFLPEEFPVYISTVINYAYGWDWLIPIQTLFTVFGAIVIFFIAELLWRSGKYLIALLRGN